MIELGRYKIGSIARMTGFSVEVLRAWETRHGLLEPVRSDGGHRMYTEDDLYVLREVKRRMEKGQSIGEIARSGRRGLLRGPETQNLVIDGSHQSERIVEEIVEGAITLDQPRIQRAVDLAFATLAPRIAIEEVIQKSAHAIGDRWLRGDCSVAGEHMATAVFEVQLGRLLGMANTVAPPNPPCVLCLSPEGEEHTLGLMITAWHLRQIGCQVGFLGGNLPVAQIDKVIEQLSPDAVLMSVTRPLEEPARSKLMEIVENWAKTVKFLFGGGASPELTEQIKSGGGYVWPLGRKIFDLQPADLTYLD
jgi:DNA-binding transcriptional MerR regulator/methylmalonyl-CoA mutase cobalamin-binding subunit